MADLPPPDHASRRALLVGGLALAVAALRVAYCFDVPWNTGDAVRHLLYGLAVLREGPGVANVPLAALSDALAQVPWARLPFNYPPGALAFDAAVAAVWPTLAGWKLALTAAEAASAWMLWRITGSRWLALAYWASPASIWWASHEGQIEPVQNALAFAAVLAMTGRRRWVGWAFLAVAVQAKGFAIFLLPWFAAVEWRAGRGEGGTQAWGFLVGALPTALMLPFWDPLNVLLSSPLTVNPWYWNPLRGDLVGVDGAWIGWVDQLASLGLLAAGAWVAWRWRRDPVAVAAAAGATLFVVALKSVGNAQPWYLMTLPLLWAPLAARWPVGAAEGADPPTAPGARRPPYPLARRVGVAVTAVVLLVEPRAVISIVTGRPVGFTMGAFYDAVDARTVFRLPEG